MRSFSFKSGGHIALVLLVLAGGCAQYDPERLAYRDRLEAGFQTPDDVQRFRTPDAQRLLRSTDLNEQMQLRAQPLNTALWQAVAGGDVPAVKAMLALPGVSANTTDEVGNPSLLVAARDGNIEMIRVLLKAGADVNGRGGVMPPLAAAALHGHTHAIQVLLRQHADVNLAGANGLSPLYNALELNQLDAAKVLLSNGANFRKLNANGENVLVLAVRKNQLDMLGMLLREGVPVDLRDSEGHTALYWSDLTRRHELSAVLRAHRANENQMAVDALPGRPYNTVEQ